MQDTPSDFSADLSDQSTEDWLTQLADIAETHGHFQPLGRTHFAAFIDAGSTLLVSFETIQNMRSLTDTAEPLGWKMTQTLGWSSLVLASDGDTWFRDAQVFDYIDALIDDGFFDEFEQVLFYGAGSCGYAAAAFSVASPGARVLALHPQATLDPRVTEWDSRFTKMRRTSFTDRYGYAPDMLDAAEKTFVLYDPKLTADAMHAALFTRDSVAKFRLPFFGANIQHELVTLDLLTPLLHLMKDDALTTLSFAKLIRTRRDHLPYLRGLLSELDRKNRPWLATMLCRDVKARFEKAPRFERRLADLNRAAASGKIKIPPARF